MIDEINLSRIEADMQRQLDRTRRVPTEPLVSLSADNLRGLIEAARERYELRMKYKDSVNETVAVGTELDDVRTELASLRSILARAGEAMEKTRAFLRPFADSVYNDNGDMTVTNPPSLGYEAYCDMYFLHKRLDDVLTEIRATQTGEGT